MSTIRRESVPKGGWTFATEEEAKDAILETLANELDDSDGFAASLGVDPLEIAKRNWHLMALHYDTLARIELHNEGRDYFYVVTENFWESADENYRYKEDA